jgi:nitrite reductase/ring-hydroxylating ferredoxin subunit
MGAIGVRDAGSWVDSDGGTVSREIFADQGVFDRELERVFARTWLLVGHEGLIPELDDYFVSRMATDSVIVTRNRQNEILVFLNSCAHRVMRLCRYDQGNTPSFTCPYHGWSYSTDRDRVDEPGALVGVPHFAESYGGVLDRTKWGLARAPNVAVYKGTIWANWDPEAPSFFDYLGDMRRYLDFALDHRDGRPGGSEVIAGVQKWRVNCNWKFVAENFAGDLYHEISHRSVDKVGIGPSGGPGRRDQQGTRVTIGFSDLGHGVLGELPHTVEPDYVPIYTNHREVEAYYRKLHKTRVRNLGDRPRVFMSVGTVFPNMSFHGRQPRTLLITHPVGPNESELWRFYLVDADAPAAVKDAARRYYLRYSGPGGMTEADDMENWVYASAAAQGAVARRRNFNYQLALGQARPAPGLTGAVESGSYSEENARIFYRRWAQFMNRED